MAILGTFNGWNIVSLPCDTIARVKHPASIEWDERDIVAVSTSPFTGQAQVYDWQASWWEGQVSFAALDRWSHDAWSAFLSSVRGPLNVFSLGDPKARKPKGSAPGDPLVDGAAQSGYTLATRGWTPGAQNILLFGDYLQVGYRLYKVTDDQVNADGDGKASIAIWPPLRDLPADGTVIVTRNCKGLFRLKAAGGNKHSVNVGDYGLSGFAIREAL